MNHFSIWLWRTTKSGLYTTADDSQLSGWTEEKLQSISQSQTCTRKWSWSLLGDLLLIWCTIAFWIVVKPLHLRSMLSKSMRCTTAGIGQQSGPILLHYNARLHVTQPTLQKLNELGYEALPRPPFSPDLSPTDYHFFKHLDNFFCRENASTICRRQKMLSRRSLNNEAWIFMLQE